MPTPTRTRRLRRLSASMLIATASSVTATAVTVPSPAEAGSRTCTTAGRATHLVDDGDTWFGIARDAEVSMRSLFSANDASADVVLHPGDVVCLPTDAVTRSACSPSNAPVHTVEHGDTWWEIARAVGVTTSKLLALNSASSEQVIRPGDRVCLPIGSATSASDTVRSATVRARSGGASGIEALPMQGPCWFSDSWGAPRGNGRRHTGVDLFAEPRSYVYAVVGGTLTRRAWDQPGRRAGNAWWLTAGDGSGTYYFYAHLADFAPDLGVGSRVQAGQIIGFMGNTGNSGFPHLHFEIHPGGGAAVNPYPLLAQLGGCKTGSGYRQPSGWIPD
ncbi:MAG TPA: LysM peptidoglycan-binding domain-containing protein [Ilumatobacteraceae bacterium]|nr:LysM peptidoglycan-binding domain-containing protein [Ilumatobacteraceae bacterium]